MKREEKGLEEAAKTSGEQEGDNDSTRSVESANAAAENSEESMGGNDSTKSVVPAIELATSSEEQEDERSEDDQTTVETSAESVELSTGNSFEILASSSEAESGEAKSEQSGLEMEMGVEV